MSFASFLAKYDALIEAAAVAGDEAEVERLMIEQTDEMVRLFPA